MQTTLFETQRVRTDLTWFRAAVRECIGYGEHGNLVEKDRLGVITCFNCQGRL